MCTSHFETLRRSTRLNGQCLLSRHSGSTAVVHLCDSSTEACAPSQKQLMICFALLVHGRRNIRIDSCCVSRPGRSKQSPAVRESIQPSSLRRISYATFFLVCRWSIMTAVRSRGPPYFRCRRVGYLHSMRYLFSTESACKPCDESLGISALSEVSFESSRWIVGAVVTAHAESIPRRIDVACEPQLQGAFALPKTHETKLLPITPRKSFGSQGGRVLRACLRTPLASNRR